MDWKIIADLAKICKLNLHFLLRNSWSPTHILRSSFYITSNSPMCSTGRSEKALKLSSCWKIGQKVT